MADSLKHSRKNLALLEKLGLEWQYDNQPGAYFACKTTVKSYPQSKSHLVNSIQSHHPQNNHTRNNDAKELNKDLPQKKSEKASKKFLTPEIAEIIAEATQKAEACSNLEELYAAIRKFDGCNLSKTALNTVIGDGNPNSGIVLVGEAPGASEDKEGIPFCGQSGKLLDNIFASIHLSRERLYITNAVFWRPPANRRPSPAELAICAPFLAKHLALLAPRLIILVGSTAVEALLGLTTPITELRQRLFDYPNKYLASPVKTVAILHPSYLLRQASQKKAMWYDMLFIQDFLAQLV